MEDLNTPEYLAKVKAQIFENMRNSDFAPSVQMSNIPRLNHDEMEVDEDLDDPNVRKPRTLRAIAWLWWYFDADNNIAERLLDSIRVNDAEFEESDDEEDVQRQRTGAASQKKPRMEAEESANPQPAIGNKETSEMETETHQDNVQTDADKDAQNPGQVVQNGSTTIQSNGADATSKTESADKQ